MKKKHDTSPHDSVADLDRRKKNSRQYLRSLTPSEKIAKLVALQEQYYQMLAIRERNDGRPIPEKWRKWYNARHSVLSDQ